MYSKYNSAESGQAQCIISIEKCITNIELQNCYIDSFGIFVVSVIFLSSSFCGKPIIAFTAATSAFALVNAGRCYMHKACGDMNETNDNSNLPQIEYKGSSELPYTQNDTDTDIDMFSDITPGAEQYC